MSDEINVISQETLPLSDMIPDVNTDKEKEVQENTAKEAEPKKANEEIVEEFSYEGYEVVRGEFFAHLFEPSVTFNDEKVAVNVACLRKLPECEYVQFLVNPEVKKLAVKPCSEDTKDSFKWASGDEPGKRKPKHITCRIFYAKVLKLMGWSPDYRYKVLGKLVRSATEQIFVFDLNCAETYKKKSADENANTRQALYPESWENQFGVPAVEHQDAVQISIFDDYTVFRIERDAEEGAKNAADSDGDESGLQETETEDIQTEPQDVGES